MSKLSKSRRVRNISAHQFRSETFLSKGDFHHRKLKLEMLEDRRLLTTIFSETFEGAFPGSWTVNQRQGDMWDDTSYKASGGSWSGHCAELTDKTSTNTYVDNMDTTMQRTVNLSGYNTAALSFYYWMNTEEHYDYLRVKVNGNEIWNNSGNYPSWNYATLNLNGYAGNSSVTVTFEFTSDGSYVPDGDAGAWLDDIALNAESYDLYGYSCYVPSELRWGENFDVQGRVGNQGYSDVSASFWQSFYLSNDPVWGDADDIYLGQYLHTATVPATVMGPQFTQGLTLPGEIPAGYSATGTFYVGMYTDTYNAVAETNETNNQPGDYGSNWDYASFTISASQWTVLVYYNGDNNLSLAGYNEIRQEMETVPYGSGVVVGVLYDGDGSNSTPTDTLRGLIRYDSDTSTIGSPLVNVGELNMGLSSTLENFIEWGTTTYPATRYALVLGDHGGGYTGFGDGGEVLEMSEVRTALSNAGVYFDLIGYDACLMGVTEVAYDVRPWCNIFVASEAETPLDGWPFDTILAELNANPAMSGQDLGRTIVSKFGSQYSGSGWPTTISSIVTSQLGLLATALDALASTSLSTATASDWTALRLARDAAQVYDPPSWGQHFRDLREFVVSVSVGGANAAIRAAAVNVRDRLDAAVDWNWHEASIRGEGLSIELPALGAEIHPDYNNTNLSFVADTRWKDFLFGMTGAYELHGYDCYVPETVHWGESFNVQGQVQNEGNRDVTTDFIQVFCLSNDLVWGDEDDWYLSSYNHTSTVPASDRGSDFICNLTLPASPPSGYSYSGVFYVGMYTDYSDYVPETNENNNGPGNYSVGWDYDTFTVPAYFDLHGIDCYAPGEIAWGQTFNVQGQVRNRGTATVTQPFYQDFYLSDDQIWGDADDVKLGWYDHQDDVPAVGNGPDFNISLALPVAPPSGYSLSGTFYIGMKTDGDNEVVEWDETNNGPGQYGFNYDWDSFTIVLPDLAGYDCYVPDEIAWGQVFNVQGQVRNLGVGTVMPPFYQDFFLSDDEVWGDADDVWLGYYNHEGDVPAGGFGSDFNLSLTLPASPPEGYNPSGTFYIGMITDALHEIGETNETNNGPGDFVQGWDWDSFAIPATYDLCGFDCYAQDTIDWGQSFSLQIAVGNNGNTAVTTDFTQGIHLSNNTVWGDADDVDLGSYLHTADVPAGSVGPDINLTRALPSSAPAGYGRMGPFYILIYTDLNGNVTETNETNNVPPAMGLTWDYDSFVVSRVWDGGSSANNLWTTKENWVGDVAPIAGDNLLFPTGAARQESVDDYPAGTVFGLIVVSGGNYHFQSNPIKSNTVEVIGNAVLTVPSIDCDTLIIGSVTGGAANAVAANSMASLVNVAAPSVVNDSRATAVADSRAIVSNAIDSMAVWENSIADKVNAATYQATWVGSSIVTPPIATAARPTIGQGFSTAEVESAVRLPGQADRQNSQRLSNQLLHQESFVRAFDADLCMAAGFDHGSSLFARPSPMIDRLKDSVYGELADSLARGERRLTDVAAGSQDFHKRALESILGEFWYNFSVGEDSDLLVEKYSQKQDKLAKKAVDEFHLQFVACE